MQRLLLSCGLALLGAHGSGALAADDADRVARGRYLVEIAGCHDCHTPGYAPSGGKVPDGQWLVGDQVGFHGPWGTTYPTNLRQRIGEMTEATWKAYARKIVTRPPMPYWALNTMTDDDLGAMWAFVQSLGPGGSPAPTALPPGQEPPEPVVRFPGPPAGK